jgi:hypothetical protein
MASRLGDRALAPPGSGAVKRDAGGVTGPEVVCWVVAVVALVTDVALTARGLALGATELNPVGRWAIAAVGPVVGMGTVKLLAVATALVLRGVVPPAYRYVVPACLAVPWTIASLANAVVVASLT